MDEPRVEGVDLPKIKRSYRDAVKEFGGKARPLWNDGRPLQELLKGVHGLLIPGGKDIDPELYGESRNPDARLDLAPPEFDKFQIAVAKEALARGIPIRGICRGLQVLNVAAGGTLIQDIPLAFPADRPRPLDHRGGEHAIELSPASRLLEIFGEQALVVNSLHHQAVGKLGLNPAMVVAARAADGIIEGIELASNRTVMGVQFHPEKLSFDGTMRRRFFESFINDARNFAEEHPETTAPSPPGSPHPGREKVVSLTAEERDALLGQGFQAVAARGFWFANRIDQPLPMEKLLTLGKHGLVILKSRDRRHPDFWLENRDEVLAFLLAAAGRVDLLPSPLAATLRMVEELKEWGLECYPNTAQRSLPYAFPILPALRLHRIAPREVIVDGAEAEYCYRVPSLSGLRQLHRDCQAGVLPSR